MSINMVTGTSGVDSKVNSEPIKLQEDTNISSKEEKLRKRREHLAAWKLKKELEDKALGQADEPGKLEPPLVQQDPKSTAHSQELEDSKSVVTPAQIGPVTDISDKKLLRQQRIEEWKRKALQTAQPESENSILSKKKKTTIALKPKKPLPQVLKVPTKRGMFDDEDEEFEIRPKFKKPSFERFESEENNDEEDELDSFLRNLELEEVSEDVKIPDKVEVLRKEILDEDIPEDANPERDVYYQDSEAENESGGDEDLLDSEETQQKLLSTRLSQLNKGKELAAVDFQNIALFRKVFYKEPFELLQLNEEEVDLIRLDLGGIKARGENCPRPILKWSQLGLPVNITNVIEKLQYTSPSPIQSQALPAIMSGRDFIGIAKTGSGKTLAFVLPMLRQVIDQEPLQQGDGPIGLILTPTRELALQIYKEVGHFSKKLSFKATCCYGGSSIETQIAELKKGSEIIIGTPGRVIDLLAANGGRVTNLKRVTYVVLDEADRMFDMGFQPQVTKIFTQIRPERQTVLFSATFPRKMETLAKKILNNPVEVSIGGISVVGSEITQKFELFSTPETLENNRFHKLVEILRKTLGEKGKILVFVEKKASADDLLVRLLANQLPCLAIHGDKEQVDRKHAIREFSSSNSGVDILIATSIAARGLDVKGLNLVINYDSPNHMEDYVHRVGRTGRAGNLGTAITFVAATEERAITELVRAVKMSVGDTSSLSQELIDISNKFMKKVKAGEEKFSYGFGGRGLENLQEIRENNRDMQKKIYGGEETVTKIEVTPDLDAKLAEILPDFSIIEGRAPETAGPDKGKFHSRITVNDLPQKARWNVMNRDSLSKVIEVTSTSITNKGQFYAPNVKVPTSKNGKEVPPKLYLLVEGLTEQAVRDANNMLREKMIEGLELAAKEENSAPVGKYKV